jgi:tetratricopeptide (TPR) repeat protein
MVMSTSREDQSSEQLHAGEAEWKALVEAGNESFSIERYSVAEIKFKEALELAEKLLEAEKANAGGGEAYADDKAKTPEALAKLETAQIRLTKSLNNLAALYHVQGKYGMAEELYEKCLDLKLNIYGEEHLEVAVNLHNLAVLHSAKRTFIKAEVLYKRALEIREKLLGAEHVDLVPVLRNYALLLTKNKRKEEGVKLQERATAIEEAGKPSSKS